MQHWLDMTRKEVNSSAQSNLMLDFFHSKFEILAATKLTVVISPSYAAGRTNNIELLRLVSDFKVNSRLKNIQRHFCGIHGMSLNRIHRRKGHFV